MSDDLILADAIYAAGQALHVDACTEGDPHDGCDCGDWDREAEIAVRAALPSIEHQLRELIAQAIEALPNLSVNHFGTRPLPDLIRKDTAARIARGDASLAIRRLLAEVRRLRAMEQRVREYARHLARPFADGVPDREGEQIASELLAVLDGGE